jgi:hypothetical protein
MGRVAVVLKTRTLPHVYRHIVPQKLRCYLENDGVVCSNETVRLRQQV